MMVSYPKITEFMNQHAVTPVGCFELYHYNGDDIEYLMFFDHKEVFDELQKSTFVATNEL